MSRVLMMVDVKGKRGKYGFQFYGDPQYLAEWRADGLTVHVIENTIPEWGVVVAAGVVLRARRFQLPQPLEKVMTDSYAVIAAEMRARATPYGPGGARITYEPEMAEWADRIDALEAAHAAEQDAQALERATEAIDAPVVPTPEADHG